MAATHSAREYRALATQCDERAQGPVSPADREFLLVRAATWRRLAAARERAAEDRRSTRRFPAPPARSASR